MKATLFRAVVTTVAAMMVSAASAQGFIATSTFDTDDEDWLLVTTLGYEGPVVWMASGGNPDGFIYGQDPDTGAFGFAAPEKFLGDVSPAYGHELSFDMASYEAPEVANGWVAMRGANDLELACAFDSPTSAYPTWHHRTIAMTEGAWTRVDNQQTPTYDDFMSVLDDLEGLMISAEFVDGFANDISSLDNVTLVPEPSSLLLLCAGALALLAGRRRHAG